MTASDRPGEGTILERLGVPPVINAADSYTVLGGVPLSDGVLRAMAEGSRSHLHLDELLDRIAERIAQLTGNEAALVTNGAATAIMLAVAEAIAGAGAGAIEATPNHRTDRTEIIVLCAQRNQYDRVVRIAGGRLVQAGMSDSTTDWQVRDAITDRTAAILWYAGTQFENYALSLPAVIQIARERGVPVIVDAAAQLPPVSNLSYYTGLGADVVAFSGGKGLRGPQSTGILVGRAERVARIRLHAFPRAAIGRPMKVSKEDACGLLAAVEIALAVDEQAQYDALGRRCHAIAGALSGAPGARASVVPTGLLGQFYPRVRIDFDTADLADHIVAALAVHDPAIIVAHDVLLPATVFVNPFPLSPAEDEVVATAISVALHDAPRAV